MAFFFENWEISLVMVLEVAREGWGGGPGGGM